MLFGFSINYSTYLAAETNHTLKINLEQTLIYRTPFKDRWGCSLAYGGPHQIFSRPSSKVTGNDSYNKFLGELHRVRGELWDKALGPDHYDPIPDCKLALQVPVEHPGGTVYFYSTPLEASTLKEISVLEDDDPDDEDPMLTVMKSYYKANIPIARLRELIDTNDVSDNLTYRCPKCSKFLDCQHSNKYRAMSIQERREQAVIEESVTLDVNKRRVTVQLSFMRDPVKFLVEKHQADSNYGQAQCLSMSQGPPDP